MAIENQLTQMRTDQREDHQQVLAWMEKVTDKLDEVKEAMHAHELADVAKFADQDRRLQVVEGDRKTRLWLARISVVAVIGAVFDGAFHLKETFQALLK